MTPFSISDVHRHTEEEAISCITRWCSTTGAIIGSRSVTAQRSVFPGKCDPQRQCFENIEARAARARWTRQSGCRRGGEIGDGFCSAEDVSSCSISCCVDIQSVCGTDCTEYIVDLCGAGACIQCVLPAPLSRRAAEMQPPGEMMALWHRHTMMT